MISSVEFYFRVFIPVCDSDPPDVKTWYHGLIYPTEYLNEWADNSFSEYDFWELFDLDPEQYWQVVGKAKIKGSYDFDGEYDEDIEILEVEKLVMGKDDFYKVYPRALGE